MNPQLQDPHTDERMGRRWSVILGVVIPVVAILGALAIGITVSTVSSADQEQLGEPVAKPLVEQQPDQQLDPPPVAPVPAAPPATEDELDEPQITEIVQHILAVPFETVETSNGVEQRLANVATGSYLAELEAQWQEMTANDWIIEGTPEVLSTEIVELTTDHAEVVACIDSSSVHLYDSAGDPIVHNDVPPANHIFTLERSGEAWRITSHGFPDDPAC